MADEDVYELHVCEAGRWSCVERFRSSEREGPSLKRIVNSRRPASRPSG
jgi:hypothetical protein